MADDSTPFKKVDEDWKRRVADERRLAEQQAQAAPPPGRPAAGATPAPEPRGSEAPAGEAPVPAKGAAPTGKPAAGKPDPRFLQFLQGIAAQALMALGQIEGLPEPDLRQAKMVIDTLVMLEEKTRGNLTREEEQAVKALLQELQSIYVQMAM